MYLPNGVLSQNHISGIIHFNGCKVICLLTYSAVKSGMFSLL
jgi:hypothetical protein